MSMQPKQARAALLQNDARFRRDHAAVDVVDALHTWAITGSEEDLEIAQRRFKKLVNENTKVHTP